MDKKTIKAIGNYLLELQALIAHERSLKMPDNLILAAVEGRIEGRIEHLQALERGIK